MTRKRMQIGTDYFASVTLPLLRLEDSLDCEAAIWTSRRVKRAITLVLKSVTGRTGTEVSEGGPEEGGQCWGRRAAQEKMKGRFTMGWKHLETASVRRSRPEGEECWQAHWRRIWGVSTPSFPAKFPMLWSLASIGVSNILSYAGYLPFCSTSRSFHPSRGRHLVSHMLLSTRVPHGGQSRQNQSIDRLHQLWLYA